MHRHTAYAADASFTIRSTDGGVVLEGMTDGPWTLVDLPPGEYAIEATSRGEVLVQTATIVHGRDSRVVFYFDR